MTISASGLITGSTNALGNVQTLQLASGTTLNTAGFSQTLDALTGSGSVLLSLGNTLTVGSAGSTFSFAGDISGQGSLVKAGSGTATLSGNYSYSGNTTISAGILKLGSDSALPETTNVTIASGAVLDVNGTIQTIGSLNGPTGSAIKLGN